MHACDGRVNDLVVVRPETNPYGAIAQIAPLGGTLAEYQGVIPAKHRKMTGL